MQQPRASWYYTRHSPFATHQEIDRSPRQGQLPRVAAHLSLPRPRCTLGKGRAAAAGGLWGKRERDKRKFVRIWVVARNTRKWHQSMRRCTQSTRSQLSSWAMQPALAACKINSMFPTFPGKKICGNQTRRQFSRFMGCFACSWWKKVLCAA